MYVLDFYFLEDPPEDHLWVIGGLLVKILVYYYLLLLLSLTICFIIFQLQFPQKDKLSKNRKGYPCIYIREPRHPSRNKDVDTDIRRGKVSSLVCCNKT